MPPPAGHGDGAALLEQLARNSTPYHDPLARVDWEALAMDAYWLPPRAISLHGDPRFQALPEAQRRSLSRHEFVGFIAAGLWLEGIFMERIARGLRRPPRDLVRSAYLLHELREECGHSLMFLELMRRSGLGLVDERYWRARTLNLLARLAPADSALFWACVLIGEEVPDRLNRFLRRHRGEICPAIADIATAHAIDEARHIAHAREVVERRLGAMPAWRRRALAPLLRLALRQFVGLFCYPGPAVYEAAGLRPGRVWAERARANPARRAFVAELLGTALRSLRQFGLELRP